jgi:hypothetical protein
MTETEMKPPENLPVDLTIHRFPLAVLQEFAAEIVVPYFNGNMNQAIKCLMEKALFEETLAKKAASKL